MHNRILPECELIWICTIIHKYSSLIDKRKANISIKNNGFPHNFMDYKT